MRRLLAVGTILSLGLLTAFLALPQAQSVQQAGPTELRGLWVVRSSLTSRASVAKMVEGAHAAGFNTLLVQVRGRGDAYFSGGIEPRAEALAVDPSFDPLGYTLQEAHARGMSVMAWVTVNLVASAHDLPRAPGHVVNRAPEWLMVPRALAQEMAGLDAAQPRLRRTHRAMEPHEVQRGRRPLHVTHPSGRLGPHRRRDCGPRAAVRR